jgi:SAM-dependent methyltransferase
VVVTMRTLTFRMGRAIDAIRRRSGTDPFLDLIERHASGRGFADVGCMWRINGAHLFHALERGASPVIGVDVMTPTPEFLAGNAAVGDRVRYVQGDINDPALPGRIGPVDVVLCTGLLYHAPNPLQTLAQLRRLCRETLIIGSITLPERRPRQAAYFLPYLPPGERHALRLWPTTPALQIGFTSPFTGVADYANWFWALTPSCLTAMTRAAGFTVIERQDAFRATRLVCRPYGAEPD